MVQFLDHVLDQVLDRVLHRSLTNGLNHGFNQILPHRDDRFRQCLNPFLASRGGTILGLVGLVGLVFVLSGCETPPSVPGSDPAPDVSATNFAVPSPNPSLNPDSTGETVSIEIYSIDQTCENLVSSQITVPADRSLDASIASLLTRASPEGLSPLNYRIAVDSTTGKATLDLRPTVSGDPPRSLRSLSSCEQLALFGSLRETLLSRSEWGIRSVEFTENGEPLVL